jgi:hypothetical protein
MVRRAAFGSESRTAGTLANGRPGPRGAGIGAGVMPMSGNSLARARALGIAAGLVFVSGLAVAFSGSGADSATAAGGLPLGGAGAGTVRVAASSAGTLEFAGSATVAGAAIGANTITAITGPAAGSIAQRSVTAGGEFGKGFGALVFSVSLSADTTSIDYRVLRAEDDVEIKGWSAATAPSLLGGTQTVTCPAVPARLGWMKIQLRSNGSASVLTYPNIVGMGRVIALAGQSLATRTFSRVGDTTTLASLGITPNPAGRVFATYGDLTPTVTTPVWELPSDSGTYRSAGAATLLNDQITRSGVNCALVGHARGSTKISAFVPGGAENPALRNVLAAVGGFEQFIWFQGHSDATGGTNQVAYRNALTALFADMTAYNAVRGANYTILLTPAPNHSSTSWGTSDAVLGIRQAQADWAEVAGAIYVQPSDLALFDGVHQSQAGAVALTRAWSRGMSGQTNPRITAATRLNAIDIRLDVALPNGATALTAVGNPATRFAVFNRGLSLTPLSLDATTPLVIGTNTITLRLASDPGGSASLDVYFALTPDPVADGGADMIYDDSPDGWTTGRQLQGTVRPVIADALSPATIAAPALTMTAPVYTLASAGFGQRLAGGHGASPGTADSIPDHASWTIEARFILATAPGSVRILTGQRSKAYLGVHGSGRLLCMFSNASNGDGFCGDTTTTVEGTNPIVADGIEHHVAMVSTPQQRRVYLDGQLILASSQTARRTGGANVYGVSSFSQNFTTYRWTGQSDEHAVWEGERYIQNFLPPALPYGGNEPGLRCLWHLDGDGTSGVT